MFNARMLWICSIILFTPALAFASDETPDPFTFADQTDVTVNTTVMSNTITVSGINAPTPISITGGEYAISTGSCYPWPDCGGLIFTKS